MSQIAIADGLYTWPGERPRLVGSRCRTCGAHAFPAPQGCTRCSSEDLEVIELSPEGTVWTWTSQEFRPPSPPYTGPEDFERYHVGFVELPDGLFVEAHLTGFEGRAPEIGELVLQLRGIAGDRQVPGNPRVGYAQLYGAPGTAGVSIIST